MDTKLARETRAGTVLREWGIGTLTQLGRAPLPAQKRPKRGTRASLAKVQDQACVQLTRRKGKHPHHEALPVVEGEGLTRMPAPSAGDVFFDIEGDAFAGDAFSGEQGAGGLEYLFGWVTVDDGRPRYHGLWAHDEAQEKAVFEQFVDAMVARRRQYPDMHIYHYAPYEPGALKRLMGRHATREQEVDARRHLQHDQLVGRGGNLLFWIELYVCAESQQGRPSPQSDPAIQHPSERL